MKITRILTFIFTALLVGVLLNSLSNVNAQNGTINLQLQNSSNTNSGVKSYILIFGQRTIGNIDNFTGIKK
jgi:hypothetical protein